MLKYLAVVWGDEKGVKVYHDQEVSAISLIKYEEIKKRFGDIPLKLRADAIDDGGEIFKIVKREE